MRPMMEQSNPRRLPNATTPAPQTSHILPIHPFPFRLCVPPSVNIGLTPARNSLAPGTNFSAAVDPLSPAEHDPIIRPLLAKAGKKLDAAGYPPEPVEGSEPDPNYEPIIATAFAWHGGQESALYAVASTRTMQSEKHKVAILAEVARNLAWHNNNPEQEPGDVEKLRRLKGAVGSAPPGTRFFYI